MVVLIVNVAEALVEFWEFFIDPSLLHFDVQSLPSQDPAGLMLAGMIAGTAAVKGVSGGVLAINIIKRWWLVLPYLFCIVGIITCKRIYLPQLPSAQVLAIKQTMLLISFLLTYLSIRECCPQGFCFSLAGAMIISIPSVIDFGIPWTKFAYPVGIVVMFGMVVTIAAAQRCFGPGPSGSAQQGSVEPLEDYSI